MSKNHHVIQLPPDQYELISNLLAAHKAEYVLPREQWKYPNGQRIGDSFSTPVVVEIDRPSIYCDADSPCVQLCIGVRNDGKGVLIAHSENQNPERSFYVHWADRRDLTGKFDIENNSRPCTFEFKKMEREVLSPVTESEFPPVRDLYADYEVLEQVRTTWNKPGDMDKFDRALEDIWRARSAFGPTFAKPSQGGDGCDYLPLHMRYRPGDYEDAAKLARGESIRKPI